MVSFVLDSNDDDFRKIEKVSMVDYGDDKEGDVSVLLYRNGNKEIFFRSEKSFQQYSLLNNLSIICGDRWVPRINYRKDKNSWGCSEMNIVARFFMWMEIDGGLVEAKQQEWSALSERVIESVKSFSK
jgi:hypothetical protein